MNKQIKIQNTITGVLFILCSVSIILLLSKHEIPIIENFKSVDFGILLKDGLIIYTLMLSFYISFGIFYLFTDSKIFIIKNYIRDFNNIMRIAILIFVSINSFLVFNLEQLNIITIGVAVIGIIWKMSHNLFKPFDNKNS